MPIGSLRLKRALVAGDHRLELLDWKSEALPHLKAAGCFTEIIQHRTRLFVPPSRAVEILGETMGNTDVPRLRENIQGVVGNIDRVTDILARMRANAGSGRNIYVNLKSFGSEAEAKSYLSQTSRHLNSAQSAQKVVMVKQNNHIVKNMVLILIYGLITDHCILLLTLIINANNTYIQHMFRTWM